MAEKHSLFAGERPATIDHRKPPVPGTPAPEVKKEPDQFTRERPGTIDHRSLRTAVIRKTTKTPATEIKN